MISFRNNILMELKVCWPFVNSFGSVHC